MALHSIGLEPMIWPGTKRDARSTFITPAVVARGLRLEIPPPAYQQQGCNRHSEVESRETNHD